jgi:Sulfatase
MLTIDTPADPQLRPSESGLRWRGLVEPLTLIALGAFAITQPILSDFRAGAGYFVARRHEPIEIVLWVVVLTIAPGLLANLFVWAADGFSEKARAVTQTLFVGLFAGLISHTTLVRLTTVNWVVLGVSSAAIGALAGFGYTRWRWWRTFLKYLIPAPLLFAAFFLFTPPISGLLAPQNPGNFEKNVESRAPVVFIVFDEFPLASLLNSEGRIDEDHYPHFARLASMSTWYKYTAAAHDYTWWALPALLTGQEPDSAEVPTASNYPGNLFTLLNESHDLHVIENFTFLCPSDMCGTEQERPFAERAKSLAIDTVLLYDQLVVPNGATASSETDPFRDFLQGVENQLSQESSTDQVGRFEQFLDDISAPKPELHFLHLLLPHAPFRYYPSGSQYNDGAELDGRDSEEVWTEPALAHQAYQRHLLQVQMMDRLIGDLLDRLESTGVLDEAILVVTADHGASFQPATSRRAITTANAYEVGMVPLFIKEPHQVAGTVDSTPASALDVLPTVAAHLGLELPWIHDGRSLLGEPEETPTLSVQARSGDRVRLDHPEQGLQDAFEYRRSVFGDHDGVIDVYSFGAYDSLTGTPPDIMANGSSGLTARVDETWRLAHVSPYVGFVPGFLHGRLFGDVDDEMSVAIALNGKINAVVPVFTGEDEEDLFTALVPDDAFVSGFNELDLLAITGHSGSALVQTIDLAGHTEFKMEKAQTGRVTRLVDAQGGFWPNMEGTTIVGNVDGGSWEDSGLRGSSPKDLHLQGWAIDEERMQPADQVVFFVNDVFAGSANAKIERQDIAEGYENTDVLYSGFLGRLAHFLPAEDMDVRAFALANGTATEIPLSDSALAAVRAG